MVGRWVPPGPNHPEDRGPPPASKNPLKPDVVVRPKSVLCVAEEPKDGNRSHLGHFSRSYQLLKQEGHCTGSNMRASMRTAANL